MDVEFVMRILIVVVVISELMIMYLNTTGIGI